MALLPTCFFFLVPGFLLRILVSLPALLTPPALRQASGAGTLDSELEGRPLQGLDRVHQLFPPPRA
ncbi:MAG: hypothetical protein C4344_04425, partial [Acidimicrobiia bacterium]